METKAVVEHFGGVKKVADALGISPAAVYQWGERVPRPRQYQLQVMTSGALQAELPESDGAAEVRTPA